MTAPRGLHTLARLHGIQTAYHDHDGRRVSASPEGLMAALRAMGVPVRDAAAIPAALARRKRQLWERVLEPVVVAWLPDPGPFTVRLPERLVDARLRVVVELEEGGERVAEPATTALTRTNRAELAGRGFVELDVPLPRVPSGYHDLVLDVRAGAHVRRHRALLLAAPRQATGWEALPGSPAWGVFAPLYALYTADAPAAIPHFGLLDRVAGSVAELGGDVVGTLPLLASFLDHPYDPSPYAPVSRLFWNELYVEGGEADRSRSAAVGGAIDYRAAIARRRGSLEAAARSFFDERGTEPTGEGAVSESGLQLPPELAAFVTRNPRARDYARFRALTEEYGAWPRWPDRLRARDVRPGDYDPDAARYHLYAQWQAERQLTEVEERAASRGVALYLDLPLGVHPEGYDVWRERHQFALGVTAGAPPDPLAPEGQDWGFHPPHPEAARLDGHRYFIAALRKHLRFARVLRIDHIMQLHRLFWVPAGAATDGVYVRYPYDELYAILSLESHRAGSVIVGEDLGTVPRSVRRRLRRHGMPGMYVVQFSLDDIELSGSSSDAEDPVQALVPGRVPTGSLAVIGTHDTPMFAAWWTGRDAVIRAERGLMDPAEAESQVAGRADLRGKLVRGLERDVELDFEFDSETELRAGSGLAVQEALYRFLGRSGAGLVLASVEDLWMETEPQNVPGTPADRNWRRRMRRSVEAIAEGAPARLLTALNDAREGGE